MAEIAFCSYSELRITVDVNQKYGPNIMNVVYQAYNEDNTTHERKLDNKEGYLRMFQPVFINGFFFGTGQCG